MPLLHDHHIHTVLSGHAEKNMRTETIVPQAEAAKLARVVILEHVPEIPRFRRAVLEEGLNEVPRPQIDAIRTEIAYWRNHTRVRLLLGAEVDANPRMRDGRLLLSDLSNVDVVLASTHILPGIPAFWYEMQGKFMPDRLPPIYADWLAWTLNIAANPEVDVLAHPGAEMAAIGAIQTFEGDVLADFEKILRACKKFGAAFELNELFAAKVPPAARNTYVNVIAVARDLGVPISISSDAHQLDKIGRFPWVETVVKALGLTHDHFFHPTPGKRSSVEA